MTKAQMKHEVGVCVLAALDISLHLYYCFYKTTRCFILPKTFSHQSIVVGV